jgi:hypothetical protein
VRKPIASVGIGTSSVPYGATWAYARPDGVTGYQGPAATSLQQPTNWIVRAGGADTNGGTSSSLTPDRSGSDGVTSGTSFTSATAAFTPADVGKGINITGTRVCKITAYVSATAVTIVGQLPSNASGQSWAIGGALATVYRLIDGGVSATPAQSGDTVYVGAGTYRQTLIVQQTPTFNGVISIVGDVTGAFTGDAGMVQLTAFTTNDKSAPSSSILLDLSSRSNYSFANILFVGGQTSLLASTSSSNPSQNITFTDCAFQVGSVSQSILDLTVKYFIKSMWLFERCHFGPTSSNAFNVTLTQGSLYGDYDIYLLYRQCVFLGTGTINVSATGSGAFFGGGIRVWNCTAILSGRLILVNGSSASAIFPCTVYGCFIWGAVILTSSDAGRVIEDYNLLYSGIPRSGVTAGANSSSSNNYASLFHFGQERIWGGLPRPFGEPLAGSPLLGFSVAGGTGPDVTPIADLFSRWRPAGSATSAVAVGALERGNTAAQGTSPAPTAGTHVWKNTGAWQQDFLIPVSAVASGFSIQVQRDSNYASARGSLPTLEILANPGIGVAYQKITDTGSASAWNTLTAAAFTPTGSGWVTVRVTSYDLSGASVVAFAVATVT